MKHIFKFKQLAQLCYGKNQRAVEIKDGNIPILGTGGVMGFASRPLYDKPSVLIGRKGTIDKPQFVTVPFWTIDTLFFTKINEEVVLPRYFYYLMCTANLSKYAEGAAVPSLTTKTLNELDYFIDDLDTQHHIVDTIGSVDDLIDKNNKEIDAITNWSASFFKTKIIGKSEDVPLSKACIFENGYSYSGSELKPSATGMVTIKSFERTGGFKADGIKAIAPSKNIKKCKQCDVGDILVAHTDLTKNQEIIGAPVLITTLGDFSSLIFSMDLVKVIPSSNLYGSVIIYQSLLASAFQKYSLGFCSGTTVVHLNKRALNTFAVSLPKVDAIDAIRKPLESGQSLIVKLTQENNWLQKEKETLLDKYFGSR
jgi:type I restriction enzyme S subunit